jgi:uncharacterized protein YbjQ (UPF0145 family)
MSDDVRFDRVGGEHESLAARLVSSHVAQIEHNKPQSESNPRLSEPPRRREPTRAPTVSTDFSVDEWLLVEAAGYEPCGLLCGVAVFHIGLVGILTGNSEVTALSSALLEARELATAKLKDEATRVGATGVVGVRLTIDMLEGKHHLARFLAIGTGIRPKGQDSHPEAEAGPAFMSALSGQEFGVLIKGGYFPVGIVMGVCVFHIGRLGPKGWLKTAFRSEEMPGYTSALYEARELAMTRLQQEAVRLKADGVVGVTTTELSHVWGSHVIEFFAIGTAVNVVGDAHQSLEPTFVLSVHDKTMRTDPRALFGASETHHPNK